MLVITSFCRCHAVLRILLFVKSVSADVTPLIHYYSLVIFFIMMQFVKCCSLDKITKSNPYQQASIVFEVDWKQWCNQNVSFFSSAVKALPLVV